MEAFEEPQTHFDPSFSSWFVDQTPAALNPSDFQIQNRRAPFDRQIPGPNLDADFWVNTGEDPNSFGLCSGNQGPIPIPCICCQVLREITHFNGLDVKRLEIHGKLGIITHVIVTKFEFDSHQDRQIIDFSTRGSITVKRFLLQYFHTCEEEGYFLLQDPLSSFYEVLSVGLNRSDGDEDCFLSSPDTMSEVSDKHKKLKAITEEEENDDATASGTKRIPLSKQRERTRNLKVKDLKDYLDLPMEEAARKMNVCPTVIKKICRKSGVERWPHRKIKSIEAKISKKLQKLCSSDDRERENARADIDMYKRELDKIYQEYSK